MSLLTTAESVLSTKNMYEACIEVHSVGSDRLLQSVLQVCIEVRGIRFNSLKGCWRLVDVWRVRSDCSNGGL